MAEHSCPADKSLASTLMTQLMTTKFNESRSMQEYTIKMINIVARLKTLGMAVDNSFLIQFILNSLLSEHGTFQMNYNTIKDK